MMLGHGNRTGRKNRGRRHKKLNLSQPFPRGEGDAAGPASASGGVPLGGGSEGLEQRNIYLTVDTKTTVKTAKEEQALYPEYGESGKLYTSHTAAVPIIMSRSDQRVHPKIYDALKACKEQFLNIEFNAPGKEPQPDDLFGLGGFHGMFMHLGVGRVRRIRHPKTKKDDVRVRIKESEFLRRLQNDGLLNLRVHVRGYASRAGFRRGSRIPLRGNNDGVALEVRKLDGEMEGVVLKIPTDLFTTFDLQGFFTVELEWQGLEAITTKDNDFLPLYTKLMEEVPKDVRITFPDGDVYECHSALLKAWSPVFTIMLECDMIETTTREIKMEDVDPIVWEAFQNFLYSGDFVGAFESCEICYDLLVLCNKYNVALLEKAIETVLVEKPDDWFQMDVALDLYFFANGLPKKKLFERANLVLQRRRRELQGLRQYQKLLEEDPEWERRILCTQFYHKYNMGMDSPSVKGCSYFKY